MMRKRINQVIIGGLLCLLRSPVLAQAASLSSQLEAKQGPEQLSSTLQLLIFLTFLTFLPAIVLTMTSFTRTVIIFSMLRNGLGTQSTPPNQILIGLSLFLTFFIMSPVVSEIKTEALDPYMVGQLTEEEFVEKVKAPMQSFLLDHTRTKDLELFVEVSGIENLESAEDLPFYVVVPSFIISELKTAFEIGFLIYIPFVVIDFIVSSVLMSMGMFMLPPASISLPFKVLLFVMVDGWHLMVESIVKSFMR